MNCHLVCILRWLGHFIWIWINVSRSLKSIDFSYCSFCMIPRSCWIKQTRSFRLWLRRFSGLLLIKRVFLSSLWVNCRDKLYYHCHFTCIRWRWFVWNINLAWNFTIQNIYFRNLKTLQSLNRNIKAFWSHTGILILLSKMKRTLKSLLCLCWVIMWQ